MLRTLPVIAATAIMLSPGLALAQAAPGNGQYNGMGYWHSNIGNANGQPGQDCEFLIENNLGAAPGNSGTAPGGGSPFTGEDSTARTHYAGSQPQHSRITASVSQYDVACANQQPPL